MKGKVYLAVRGAVERLIKEGRLKEGPIPEIMIQTPPDQRYGDFSTNIAMLLASSQGISSRDIAMMLRDRIEDEAFERVEVAGPGFLNFFIRDSEWPKLLSHIHSRREDYGSSDLGKGKRVLVEFVSANPTGPLHLGHGRGAALGDSLCRILSYCGFEVVREFYINDAGRQIELLGRSIYSVWKRKRDPNYPFPEDGYRGSYIEELSDVIEKVHSLESLNEEEAIKLCAEVGSRKMLDEIRRDLELFRCPFDIWFSEKRLYGSGSLKRVLDRYSRYIYEKDGALWFKTSLFGDTKDRVLKKRDGVFTYFASDISYHLDKWERGFDRAINIWGADHHGYIDRIKAALKACSIDEGWLSVLLIQLVKLYREGKEVRMSKRAGDYVTLKELIDEVGVDAVRFVFLTKSHDSPLDFDVDLVKRKDSENPVYYVQYAHARACSIFRKAEAEGIRVEASEYPLDLLTLSEETQIIKILSEFPYLLKDICRTFQVHRLTYYLQELASLFHRYFNMGNRDPKLRVLSSEREMSIARLVLTDMVRAVIAKGLSLLGVSAPERM